MNHKALTFFQGNTQYENTGDVLINKSLIQLLRKQGDVVVNDAQMPEWYVTSLNLMDKERITRKNITFTKCLLKSLFDSNVKVYIIAGPPGHLFGNSAKKSFRNIISGCFFLILQAFGAKIIKIGFSMGPIGKSLSYTEWFRALFTNYYLVRDSISLKLAKTIGIHKASFFPDLAWAYEVQPFITVGEKETIVLSFRNSIVEGQSSDQYLERLRDTLFSMLKSANKNYHVVVSYQVERDFEFCKKLYVELSEEIKVSFNETQVTLENASNTYKSAVCIITNRLHGALLAYKYGALPLVLTDANDHLKIKGIYLDAGISNLILDVNANVTDNIENFQILMNNRGELMDSLRAKELEYMSVSNNVLRTIYTN